MRKHTRYVPTPVITDTLHLQLYQRGQWVRLAWCDHPSRLHSVNERGNVTAFHFPGAGSRFNAYVRAQKANDAFTAFNRHARQLSNQQP